MVLRTSLLSLIVVLSFQAMAATPASVVASRAGARLNSSLEQGGGADDTAVLQRMLNRGQRGGPLHLIIDGPALIGGLDIYGNTTIECVRGGGFYLKDGANRAILRNANRSRGPIIDEHITIRGCSLNGNSIHQKSPGRPPADLVAVPRLAVAFESDGTWKTGLQFLGVRHLAIEGVKIRNARTFASFIANAFYVDIRNVTVEVKENPEDPTPEEVQRERENSDDYLFNDGLHFIGPVRFLSIDGANLRTRDDAIGLNANDGFGELEVGQFGPYVGEGDITDVTIKNIVLNNATHGIRLLSKGARVDRITVENISGTVLQRMVTISSFLSSRPGNFGTITFNNVSVRPVIFPTLGEVYPDRYRKASPASSFHEEGESPMFSVNAPVEKLTLNGFRTTAVDRRPLIRIGPRARIGSLSVKLDASNSAAFAPPLQLWQGSEINDFSYSFK